MTDYKNLKLIATSNPHIRSNDTTRSIMLDVIIAMLPALIWSVVEFGVRAIAVTLVSVAGSVFFEWLYRNILKKPQSVGDLSAVVTGMLLAFVCPVNVAYWQILIGDAFAIIMVKQLFGGIGKNFLNPALAGRAFMLASFASTMSGNWIDPAVSKAGIASTADIVTAATPLTYLKGDDIAATFQTLTETYSVGDMFLGKCGGSLGEVSALCLLLGLVWLLFRKVISWHIPVSYIATVAVLTLIFPRGGADAVQWMLYNLFGGGLMLGAIFMATDYVTSPMTHKGMIIYGVCIGLLTVIIRNWGSYPEGMSFAILIMNAFTPLINTYVKPKRFGEKPAKK